MNLIINPMTTRNCVYRHLEMASVFSSVIKSSPKLPWGCCEFDKLYENVVSKIHFHYFLESLELLYMKQLALRSHAHHKNWRLKNYKHIEGYFKTLKTCLVVPLVTVPDGFMKQSVLLVLTSSHFCADTCTFFTSFLRLLFTSI